MGWKLAIVLGAVLNLAPAFAAAQTAGDFQAANAAAKAHTNDFIRLDDDARAPALLEQQWKALRGFASGWLDRHPKARPGAVEASLKALKPQNLSAQALQLDSRSWLISVDLDGFGTVFILTDKGGGFRPAWAIDRPQTWASGPTGPLMAWAPEAARDSCRSQKAESRWDECGPLSGAIGALPRESSGARRLYVNDDYQQIAGATIGTQFSVWSWDRFRGRPMFSRNQDYMIDQPWTLRVRGRRVDIRAKEEPRHLFACGGCEGRQVVTSFELSNSKVREVGRKSLTPELDLIDEVYDRIARRRDLRGLASESVAKFMEGQLKEGDAYVEPKAAAERQVGLIDHWKLVPSGLCLETDSGGAAVFTLAGVGSHSRIVHAQPVASGACDGPGSHS